MAVENFGILECDTEWFMGSRRFEHTRRLHLQDPKVLKNSSRSN